MALDGPPSSSCGHLEKWEDGDDYIFEYAFKSRRPSFYLETALL